MLLCDIASLSRLSITIFSLTGKPLLQVGLYHSEEYATGKTAGSVWHLRFKPIKWLAGTAGVPPADAPSGAQTLGVALPTRFRASRLFAGETPAVPANHLIATHHELDTT